MIILASASPRRKELLESIGMDFIVVAANVDESVDAPLSTEEYVLEISKRKAAAVAGAVIRDGITQAVVIAADTVVSIEGRILGKPKDEKDAFDMLKLLENAWHGVYTGICAAFIENGQAIYKQDCCQTNVKFKPLTSRQIEEYISTGEPFDKAGAYGIQGEGGKLIEKIEGDYDNVVGLPVANLIKILKETNYHTKSRF